MKYLIVLMLVTVSAGCGAAGATPKAPAAESAASDAKGEKPAAAANDVTIEIVSYDGILERVAKNKGKVVVMDAWSTSCVPCLKEFHNLVELHQQYPETVACMSLSFDYEGIDKPEDQVERVLDFLRGQHATFENLLSNEESDVLYRKFDLAAIPAVFVYDREGKLRKRFDNQKAKSKEEQFTYAQVRELVAELLKEGPAK